ncbi:hypothetical protein FBQ87_04390 [Sphingobacteriales bacterium CHB3]|nr:hypothetical protein [Sphingobacteriales bacterium CHB3]
MASVFAAGRTFRGGTFSSCPKAKSVYAALEADLAGTFSSMQPPEPLACFVNVAEVNGLWFIKEDSKTTAWIR